MPDILILGMEMPQNCVDCYDADLSTAIALFGAKCPFARGIIDPGVYDLCHERHPDCPLHELPPHGDLVDATQYRDEFMDGVYNMCADDPDNNRANVIIDLYDCAPVVVPAERSESHD